MIFPYLRYIPFTPAGEMIYFKGEIPSSVCHSAGLNRGNPEEINTQACSQKLLHSRAKWKSPNFSEKSLGKLSGITDGEGRQKGI